MLFGLNIDFIKLYLTLKTIIMIRTQSKAMLFVALFFAANMLTGCELIGGIFKTGVGVGVVLVVIVVALVLYFIGRAKK